jgi:hypothetical protein
VSPMFRLLVTMFVTALLLGAPVLCLAGVVTHACSECSEAVACGHEGDCAEDPCSETAVRPGHAIGYDFAPPLAVLPIAGPCGPALAWSVPAARPPSADPTALPPLSTTHHPLLI